MGRKMIGGCHDKEALSSLRGVAEAIQTFLCHSEFIFLCHSELAKQVKNLKRKAEEMFRLKAQHDKREAQHKKEWICKYGRVLRTRATTCLRKSRDDKEERQNKKLDF